MKLQKSIILVASALAAVLSSCDGFKTSDNGIKYKIVDDSAGASIEKGGLAFVNMYFTNEKDTFDSKKRGAPIDILIPLDSQMTKGSFEEGLTLLTKGDSATFIISTDSVYKSFRQPLPEGIKPGGVSTFQVRVVNVIGKDSVDKLRAKAMEQQMAAQVNRQMRLQTDTMQILEYLKKNRLKAKRTMDGVYVVIKKSQQGMTLQPGDTANTMYTGKLLDGTKFDSNEGGEPFPVVVGYSQVIPGWHSGLMSMKKGEKATLFIPSGLAYGEYSPTAAIPPNSILMFDVEVKK